MKQVIGTVQTVLGALVGVALCLSLLSLRSCADSFSLGYTPAEQPGGGGTGPPSNGVCDNIGQTYPDNPFSGWPTASGPNWGIVTATYCDPDYFEQFGVNHKGIDLGYTPGTAVVATADGVVSASGWHDEMGIYVRIESNGWTATYMHLSSPAVQTGDSVTAGQVLGFSGNTGNSTGPHLHYQFNGPDWNTADPAPTMNQ